MASEISLADVGGLVGAEVGVSDWIMVDQSRIDRFADATDDHQFIHCDPVLAAETPFRGTIAHGFLTLSLLSAFSADAAPQIREQTMGINYAFENVRFISPVKAGARLRGRFILAEARLRGASILMLTYDVTVEIENEKKAALTARWITIIHFDPKDRPEGL